MTRALAARAGVQEGVERLAGLVRDRKDLFVLTGAGCSTGSGIPDYRDRHRCWKGAQPIRYADFMRDATARRRYWARSFVGWPRVAAAEPNSGHRALAALEGAGYLHHLVTQNVDGLHQRAGQRRVIDLHGRLAWVDCLGCERRLPRAQVQAMLAAGNSHLGELGRGLAARVGVGPDGTVANRDAPDGDAFVAEDIEARFRVPTCPGCGGLLKPGVVFFGENVPHPRVKRAFERLRQARMALVVGSSLTVFSGFRFCREAAQSGIPLALINRGETRADDLAAIKVDAECGEVLAALVRALDIPLSKRP